VKIRKDDTVLVIAGKDRGKSGKVRQSFPKQQRVVVEGVNTVKRHVKPRANVRQAGIVERDAPIHISNVVLLCPKCSRPGRIGSQSTKDGARARVCRRCGEVLD